MPSSLRQALACCVATLCLSTALAGRAAAQEVAPPDEPAETDESAAPPPDEEPKERFTGEVTVVGAEPTLTVPSPELAAEELARVPGGASFIDALTYRSGRAATLKETLDFAPGVFVQPRFGAEEARLSIRGSGLQRTFHGRGLKLLQDGVPLNLADGAFDFQAVEPLGARYVEVFRGANALNLGSSTLGGAINYVSPTGYEAARAQGRLEGGAFGYLRGQASAGGIARGADYFATLTHFSQDGFREHAEQATQRFFGNLGRRFSEDRETRFYLTAVHTDSELPGSLTKAQLAADPRRAAPGNLALDQKRDFDLVRLANRSSFRLGPAARFDVGAFWSYKRLDHPIFQVLDQLSHDVGVDLRYATDRPLAGRPNHFLLGFAPAVGVLDDDRFRNVAGRRGARTARGETTSTNFDLYAEDRHEVRPGLTLVAGLQLTRAGRDFADDFLDDGDQDDVQEFTGASPKLGVAWEVSPDVLVFGNVARSFEPPSFGELANLGGSGLLRLDAQTATTVEAGSRGRSGRIGWDVVLYHARLDGELLSLNDLEGNPLGTLNAGRTLHSGVEAGFEARLGAWRLRQVYTWSRFRFAGDPAFGDNQLAGMPEHFLRTELLYEHPRGVYGGPNFEWVPARYPVDHANTLFADDYAIVGLKAGYRGDRGLGGFVEAKNLTDETYAATTGVVADARGRDAAQFLPGDGASVYAGLEVRW